MVTVNPQLLKGTLDGALLLVISNGETYGYEIATKLEAMGFLSIAAGTIYPILQKLEREGYISSKMSKSSDGPKRKYLTLTEEGKLRLQTFLVDWSELISAMANLIKETGNDKHHQK